ncbi:hypothetical protein FO519_001644 [Halicephalobus sp. NKZ332]|nr:hypothetical protein FO519_001644 [Halicephalobus sp. NKZ332]
MSALLRLLLLACALAAASAAFTPLVYKDCKSAFKIHNVEVDGCPKEGDKCAFKRGEKPAIKITFTPGKSDVTSLTANVRSKMAGGTTFTTFNLNPEDACQSGLSCPLKAGETYTYEQSVEIANTYPLVDDVQVNWALEDDSVKGKEVCIVFLARITE